MGPKKKAIELHGLAQRLHIILEDMQDLEERIVYLIKVSNTFSKASILLGQPITVANEIYMLEYLLSKCLQSKRWVANYRDRANIRINLVRNTRCQKL